MEKSSDRLKLCRVVTVPTTFVSLLRHQLKTITENDIDVTIVSSPEGQLDTISRELGIPSHAIEMSRAITPLDDIRSVIRMYRLFRAERFDIVHSSTAKAGLVAALAGRLARVPVRLHTYTGQRWVELKGVRRWAIRLCDRIMALLNTHCYADSHSQRAFLIRDGIVPASKISVLASGSISGVDLNRFDPDAWGGVTAAATRRELGISDDALVILFVGRVNRDKGVIELLSAFEGLRFHDKSRELVLVGPFEPRYDPLPQSVVAGLNNNFRIHLVGRVPDPERYMGMADILCLPSYREGFGSVVIEAAAMGVPAVATSIVGLVDAVEQGKTGLLVASKNVEELRAALATMIRDRGLRRRMGAAARKRARLLFDAAVVNQVVADEYRNMYCPPRPCANAVADSERLKRAA